MWFLCVGTALAQPDNDTFDRREKLRGNRVVAAGTTADASRDRWEAEITGAQVGQGVVWWEWTAPASGLLTVTVETGQEIWGIPFRGQLKFFEGDDPGALRLAGEILNPGPLTVPVEAGRSYSIAVVWDSRHPSAFGLRLALPMAPPNDSRADAEELAGDWVIAAGTLWDATPDFHGAPSSVWWRWTAPRAGFASIRSAQSGSRLAFRVWRADQNPGSDAQVSDNRPQGEDLLPNVASVLSSVWPVDAGQTFWIAAESPMGGGQDFQFRLALSGIALLSDRDALVTGETASITLSAPPDMGATWRRAILFDGSAVIRTNRDWTAPFEWSAGRPGLHQLEAVLEDTSGRRWPATNRLTLRVRNWVPPEINDRFEDRLRLPARTNLVIRPGRATVDPGEPGANGGSLWFEWVAEENGRMMVSLPLYSPLAQITAFSGASLETLQAVPLETTTNHWLRDWYLPVVAGQRGVFRISGDQRHPDSELILGFAVGPVPTNDDFTNRIELPSGSFQVVGNNGLAIREPGEPRVLGRSVWYQWVAPAEGTLAIPGPPAYERQVFVYSGTQWPPAVRTPAASVPNAPQGVYTVGEGIHYLICITGPEFDFGRGFFNGGPFELRGLFSPSPLNDGLLSAIEVQGDDLLISGSVAGAQPTTSLTFTQRGHRYLWYEWLASGSGEVLISLPVSFGGRVLVVDSAAPGAQVSTQTQPGQWVFRAEAGTRYRLGIGNAYGGPDEFQASLRVRGRAGNDEFDRRMSLSGTPVRLRAASWQSSIEPGEPAGGPPGAGSLWWTWRAPKSGWAALRSEVLPALRVFTGSQLESLTEVPVTTDPPGDGLQEARFDVVGGTTYQIAMMAAPHSPFDLSVELDHSTFVISSPQAGDVFVAGREARLAAEPPDPSVDGILTGPVTVIRYPEFGSLPALGTLTSLPGSVVLSILQPPEISLRLRATNAAGLIRWSPPLHVPVLPPNDAPASARPLEGTNGSVAVQLMGSTLEAWEPSGDPSVPQGSVWFHWRAPATGQAWFRSALPPHGANDVRLYSQNASQRLQEVPLWKDRDGVGLLVERAAEYWIRVAGDTRVHSSSLDWESWPFRVVVPGPGIVLASQVSFELMADVPQDDISEVLYLHWGSMSGPGRSPPWKVTPERLAAEGMGTVGAQIGFRNGTVVQIPESAFVRWRPDNDDLARAIPWREHSVSWVSTAGATLETGEPAAPSGSRTLWWSFVAPDDGFVRMASGDAAHPMEAFRVPQTDSWNGAVRVAGPAGSGDVEVRRGQKFLFRLVASAITQVSVDFHFSRVGANQSPESAASLPNNGGPLRAEFGPSGASGSSRFWWIEPDRSGVMFFEQSDPYPGEFRWNLYPDGILTGRPPFLWPDHHPVQQGRRYLVECWLREGHFGTWTGRAVIQDANTNDHLSRRWEVPPTGLQRRFFLGDTPSDPSEPVINLTAGPSALRSLWFSWTSPRRQYATFWSSTVAPLGVFEGDSLNSLWMMARSNWEPITFLAEPGRTYSMLLQQAGGQEYGITVGVGPVPAPRGDDFAGRGRVHGFDAVLEFDCEAATREPGEPWHGGSMFSASSWWSWTAPATGVVQLSRQLGIYNPFDLTVYRGTELARLTPVTGTGGNSDIRVLELPVEAGEELQFAGVSRQGPFGPFHHAERWLLRFRSGFDPEADLQVTPLADGLEVRWPEALDGFVLETTTDPVRRDWQAVDHSAGNSVRLAAPATGAVYFRMRAP